MIENEEFFDAIVNSKADQLINICNEKNFWEFKEESTGFTGI